MNNTNSTAIIQAHIICYHSTRQDKKICKWSDRIQVADDEGVMDKHENENQFSESKNRKLSSWMTAVTHQKPKTLISLDDDTLREILVRTGAEDHLSLRLSSQRLHRILNSKEFRRLRCLEGYVQVKCVMDTPFQQYQRHMKEKNGDISQLAETDDWFLRHYNEFGLRQRIHGENSKLKFLIQIDGMLSAENAFVSISVLPRTPGMRFLAMCVAPPNDDTKDLQDMAFHCFLNCGGLPLSQRIRGAMTSENDTRPLVFIHQVNLPPEYRDQQVSKVLVPLAVRSLLHESLLKDKWSLAMYVPSGDLLSSNEAQEQQHPKHNKFANLWGLQQIYLKDNRPWDSRWSSAPEEEMRLFFQAGFQQVDDPHILEGASKYFLFATPESSQVSQTLSAQAAMKIKVVNLLPTPPRESTVIEQRLHNFVLKQVNGTSTWNVAALGGEPKTVVDDIRHQVLKFVNQAGSLDVLLHSYVIHSCVFHMNLECLNFFLRLLPPVLQFKALNNFDEQGKTPLMLAASEVHQSGISKRYEICQVLIQHGADKNVTTRFGLTALGCFRKDRQIHCDPYYRREHAMRMADATLEALLMPSQGPTPADDAVVSFGAVNEDTFAGIAEDY